MSYTLLKTLIWLLIAFIVVATGYFFGYQSGKQEQQVALIAERQHSSELKKALSKAQKMTASHEYEKAPPRPPKRVQVIPESTREKPKLAIIIDDVSFAHDVRNVKALGLNLNLSFLPPSKRHPDSAKLAAREPFYMVHLPMEALSFASEEPHTLHVGDDAETIKARVGEIKRLFPRVTYVNNHTGSRFTSDRPAMEKLLYALDREGITFVDSRTTAKTAVPSLMQERHRPYLSRDVFLDHDPEVDSVKKQIRRAVRIAKKYGTAIAIGHPHKKTLQGLAESKAILKEVELVRIDTLAADEKNE
ncbi:MAG: divergent polysaccharide deacetylase family protein [Campylobacterales bacterium]